MTRHEKPLFDAHERGSAIFLIYTKYLTADGRKKFTLAYLHTLADGALQTLFENAPVRKDDVKKLKKDIKVARDTRDQQKIDRLRMLERERR